MGRALLAVLLAAGLPAALHAQSSGATGQGDSPRDDTAGQAAPIQATTAADEAAVLPPIDGPPPPLPPEVIARDAAGRATVRAVRLAERIELDGRLDEDVYDLIPPIGGFVQQVPDPGAAASEPTEAWVMFDGANLYVAARCHDSAPPGEWVANDMRRDTPQLRQNDTFAVILDTFYDRRNGVAFYTNPLGARADFAITNEGSPNSDWNPVWGRAGWPLRGRLDRRDGDSVQVAQIPVGCGAGVGLSIEAGRQAQERGLVSHAAADLGGARQRDPGDLPGVRRGHAGRSRGAAGQPEFRNQAVCDRRGDDRCGWRRGSQQRWGAGCRRGCQGWASRRT